MGRGLDVGPENMELNCGYAIYEKYFVKFFAWQGIIMFYYRERKKIQVSKMGLNSQRVLWEFRFSTLCSFRPDALERYVLWWTQDYTLSSGLTILHTVLYAVDRPGDLGKFDSFSEVGIVIGIKGELNETV